MRQRLHASRKTAVNFRSGQRARLRPRSHHCVSRQAPTKRYRRPFQPSTVGISLSRPAYFHVEASLLCQHVSYAYRRAYVQCCVVTCELSCVDLQITIYVRSFGDSLLSRAHLTCSKQKYGEKCILKQLVRANKSMQLQCI